MSLELRAYQDRGLDELAEGVKQGHKHQILCGPTGSGKTLSALHLLKRAAAKFSQTAFICDRIALIDQTSRVFDSEGIDHGVIQGNHFRFKPWERIQICSVQTLARRNMEMPWKLIVVDECHSQYSMTTDFIKSHPDVVVVGLSATPLTAGLGNIYTRVVNVTTTLKLVEEGFLAPIKFYVAKALDMSGAEKKFDGEWKDAEMEERGIKIVGDVVEEWIKKTKDHFGGPAKTICFSATVAHGEEICRQFQAAGYNFQQVSYKDGGGEDRARLIEEFRKPESEIDGLVSVEALAKGFDVPDIRVGIGCKPYRKSLSSVIQQIGRVMRSSPGKDYALWLDHANNLPMFGDDIAEVFEIGVNELKDSREEKARKEPTEEERKKLQCGACGHHMTFKMTHCPSCGWERPRRQSGILEVSGTLHEMSLKSKAEKRADYLEDKDSVWRQIVSYAMELKRGDMQAAERYAKAQYRTLYDAWPRYAMRNITPEPCSAKLASKLLSMRIAYAKSMKRRSA
jgi:superfamily II DNA or RNA helicase